MNCNNNIPNSFTFELQDTNFTTNIVTTDSSILGITLFIVLVMMIIGGIVFFIKKNPMKN